MGANGSRRRDARRQQDSSADVTRIEGDPPPSFVMVEKFRNERKVRLAVRTALASVVRPLTGMLSVPDAFDVVEQELAALRTWFEAQVAKQKKEEGL